MAASLVSFCLVFLYILEELPIKVFYCKSNVPEILFILPIDIMISWKQDEETPSDHYL